jgi:hypothetical protein
MKYFTPELYARGNSSTEADVQGVEEEWEQALRRYQRRWKKIRSALPKAVRHFAESQLCLHDAEVLHLARQGSQFFMILQLGSSGQTLVILTFTLREDPLFKTEVLPERVRTSRSFWLYEEFDLDRAHQPCFRVLLSSGCVIQFRFRNFQFLVGQKVGVPANGQAAPRHASAAVRSA